MKLPISWLRDWVNVEAEAPAIAEALTLRGFYVESIDRHGHHWPGVVTARVLEVGRHPNADRLSLCRVDSGAGTVSVVCGAPNVKADMIAPLATVGAVLPGGAVIRKSTIRGQESQGMLCSARELGLSEEHEGIVDLERLLGGSSIPIGQPLETLFGPPDDVLEIEVPFNRPDGQGVLGLAREVKAALGGRWTDTARSRLAAQWTGRKDFDLEIEDAEGCPRYIAQVVEGVQIAPSPAWLRRKLEVMGQRAINNVVDITNLVLLDMGQPMHAFDLARLHGPSIRVRRAKAGEKLVTLDGKERTLDPEVLVIADRDRAVALGGIMGGLETEVTDATTQLLLECAWFDPRRVRRGSRALGLATEASRRFERGVDPEIGGAATARFLALLREISPGFRLGTARERLLAPPAPRTIRLRTTRCARLLGMPVKADEAARHLEALEFRVERGDPMAVRVPTWRPDVTLEDDLVEEVGRAHGYDDIPENPAGGGTAGAVRSPHERTVERARRAMVARGLVEAWTTSLISDAEARAVAPLTGADAAQLVRLKNPMSREGEVLRPSPVAGLLRACAHNLRQGAASVRLFEVGNGFQSRGDRELPDETPMLSAVVCGMRWAHAHDESQGPVDFADARGLWEAWLQEMGVDGPTWRAYASPGWKPGASAEVATAASRIAWAGTLGQDVLRAWDIEVPVHLFTVLLGPLSADASHATRAKVPGRFPPVRRDVAFWVPVGTTHRDLEATLRRAAGEWLLSLELFDVYSGSGTPEGMKSLAFALQFQHPERTLEESEVQGVQDRMTAAAVESHGARLRDR